ncbi:3-isopropylmalate dehydratase small subunit [Microbulbifer bruguierae]|uniref:3-isopropylmalate dehydratase small subunit n=1 Tax=Microbulbifer bruguierae TaxID=3029061 RepID=A0ABY8NEW6_9GAMM|nr:3-isopropylmalate dehydratase small subunit [Microbulbifer bruguierae]WGL16292.1 3-isopropylmalate dehydratase small subunit [Microbulbifer bruguierae]
MKKFQIHRGVAAPLLRVNVDTDAIIPSREMKLVSKKGLSEGLFAGWRYTEVGGRTPTADFVLNRPEYVGASILLSGPNFGCGSSREHAVWALSEFGIRAIVAPSFGVIFQGNCERNGILPVVLDEAVVRSIAEQVEEDPQQCQVTIDLEHQQLLDPRGRQHRFEIARSSREMLLNGLDQIGLTLNRLEAIEKFEEKLRARRPWLFEF